MVMPHKGRRVAVLVRMPEHIHRILRDGSTPDPTVNDRINRYIADGIRREVRR